MSLERLQLLRELREATTAAIDFVSEPVPVDLPRGTKERRKAMATVWAEKVRDLGMVVRVCGLGDHVQNMKAIEQHRRTVLDVLKWATLEHQNAWTFLCNRLEMILGFDNWNFNHIRTALRSVVDELFPLVAMSGNNTDLHEAGDAGREIPQTEHDSARASKPESCGGRDPVLTESHEGDGDDPSSATREKLLKQLKPSQRKAYLAFEYAATKLEQKPNDLQDSAAHESLQDEGMPEEDDEWRELDGYTLPSFDTWSRQVRAARAALNEQKNNSRIGRATGKSVVKSNQIE